MTYFGTSDLPALLADFGVPVVWGSVSGKGIVDIVDRELLTDGSVQFTGKETMVTLETERFVGLKEAETLFISGAPHRVLQTRQVGDGALTAVLVVPIPGTAPAPLRIAKGSDARHDLALGPAPILTNVSIAAGSTIVVGLSTNGGTGPGRGATSVQWGATALTKRGERNYGSRGVTQFWTLQNASAGTADLTATIPVSGGVAGAMWVCEIQNAAAASFGELWSAAGNDDSPIVVASGATSHANSILMACVGQEGEAGPLGLWGHSFIQGHSDATPGGGDNDCQINGGYRNVIETAIYTADETDRASAPWSILLMSIKGN